MKPQATPRRVAFADQRTMPWRNGHGSTREVAIEPAHATVQGPFRWRISRATVGADGPFSVFPGLDRSLWLVRGAGIEIDVEGVCTTLSTPFARIDFRGEAVVHGHLLDGPIEDLNVMWDRARITTTAAVLPMVGPRDVVVPAGTTWIVALAAPLRVDRTELDTGDALAIDGARTLRLAGTGAVLVATFAPRDDA